MDSDGRQSTQETGICIYVSSCQAKLGIIVQGSQLLA